MQLRTNTTRFWPAWILLAGVAAPSVSSQQPLPCSQLPGVNCPTGTSTSTVVSSDAFGPITSQWHTEPPLANAPRLLTNKFVPGSGQTLIQADITITATAGGQLRVENRDPLNACLDSIGLNIDLAIEPVGGVGVLGQVPLSLSETYPLTLQAFDGAVDFQGPSGETITVTGVSASLCFRVTDPAVLAALTDSNPGDGIQEKTEWMHQAGDNSNSVGCAPQTFESDPLARLEVSVTYKVCSVVLSDCDHDGISDQDEIANGTQHDNYSGTGDCVPNGIPDECESSIDCDGDHIPDQCDTDTSSCVCRPVHRRNCGSLLLYPELDNRLGRLTLISITNSCCDDLNGSTAVEFRFINKDTCLKDDRTYQLTPCDTLTFITAAVNPNPQQGYVYVYAKQNGPGRSPNPSGVPIVFNHLIGQEVILDGIGALSYSMNAVAFRGLGTQDGEPNDDDNDGIRDLNGPAGTCANGSPCAEYEEAPDEILIPRFLGQDDPSDTRADVYTSELILVNLSGGARFHTTVSFLVYNDNEEPTSGQYEFTCWDKVRLSTFSSATLENYLRNLTTDDPDEILGHNSRTAGWIRLDGQIANSEAATIDDPAIYAVLVERTGAYAAADLPWEECSQSNGDLLPLSLLGDS